MNLKDGLTQIDEILNRMINNNRLADRDERMRIQAVNRDITKAKIQIKTLEEKLHAVSQLEWTIKATKRKVEYASDIQLFEVKTAIRMAYQYSMPYPASEFYERFIEDLGEYAKNVTITEEQLLVSPTLAFGEHYDYLYTFIKIK